MAASFRLSTNEKEFIEFALQKEHRIDGRRPFDSRRLSIKFAKEDGTVEVQLGQTRIMAVVSAKLEAPYRDRPNEGSFAIFTEFSPMGDPYFEPGRPGEFAVELGRVIDRGLRESRAVDTESLCIVAGRAVWALRLDLHVLDNGGNLVDASNIAALAALLSFRRPECTVGGPDGQDIIVHPTEVREPLPLILHHLPIATTFAFFGDGTFQVVDPSFKEEAVMGARLSIIVNAHGEVCAMQKGGGIGVSSSEILRCLRVASAKATDITAVLKKAVEAHELERAQRKVKRHPVVSESIKKTMFEKTSVSILDKFGGQGKVHPRMGSEREENVDNKADPSRATVDFATLDTEENAEVLEVAERMNIKVKEMSIEDLEKVEVSVTKHSQKKVGKSNAVTTLLQTSLVSSGREKVGEAKKVTESLTPKLALLQPEKQVQESLKGGMSAAAVYANQLLQYQHEYEKGGRILGPIFPKVYNTVDLKVEQNSNDSLADSRNSVAASISGECEISEDCEVNENHDLLPQNLLRVNEKKLKKRKKLGRPSSTAS